MNFKSKCGRLIAGLVGIALANPISFAADSGRSNKSIFDIPDKAPAEPAAAPPLNGKAPLKPVAPQPVGSAQAANVGVPVGVPRKLKTSVTVAILDFETKGNADLGKEVPDALAAMLGDVDGMQLVERTEIARVLQEQAVNLSGMVDADKAVKVGKIIGAQILVTGKIFPLDKDTYVTVKLIGSETSAVKVVSVKGHGDRELGNLLTQVAGKIGTTLQQHAADLLPSGLPTDPLPLLKQRLAAKQKPTVSVAITEQHRSSVRNNFDPAVETEFRRVLVGTGFDVIDAADKTRKADLAVTGEALSQFGAIIGSLTACSARIEVKASDQKAGKLSFVDRTTAHAADLSEVVAGKSALQKGGRDLAIKFLTQLADTLPNK